MRSLYEVTMESCSSTLAVVTGPLGGGDSDCVGSRTFNTTSTCMRKWIFGINWEFNVKIRNCLILDVCGLIYLT